MTVPLSPKARSGLYLLLYTAAETLFDGTYHLDGRSRRSPHVTHAANVLHDLSRGLCGGLLNENSDSFERHLVDVADAFDQLDTININVISLMVRRDLATEHQRKRASAARVRDRRSSRGHLRLVGDDEQS